MTNPKAAEQDSTAQDDVVAAHLAAIAEMHAAALAHIASVAEPWLRSSPGPSAGGPVTNQIAVSAIKPPARAGGNAAA